MPHLSQMHCGNSSSVIRTWFGVKSDKWKVSLYMANLQALKPLQVKDWYHVTCTVALNYWLDKGHKPKNMQKDCLWFFKLYFLLLLWRKHFNHIRFVPILLQEGFMSNLHKSERLDLADMFDGMCRYLDGILSIYNPGFEKKKTYLRYNIRELNKANSYCEEIFS